MQPNDTNVARHSYPSASATDLMQLTPSQFAAAMEHSAIGTALVALDGRTLLVNTAIQRLLGYSAAEFVHVKLGDITHPDDAPADANPGQRILAGEISAYQTEKRYIHKDGRAVWVLLSVSLVKDEASQPQCFLSQLQDISERKAADLERQRLTERLTLATRATRLGVWEWDIVRNELFWDDRMFEIYGLEPHPGPVDMEPSQARVHSDDRASMAEEMRRAIVEGRPFDTECRIIHPVDGIRYVRALAAVVRGPDDRALRVVGTNWDVSETRRLSQQAQAANEAKSQFLAAMSHEIRTPLNGVLGMAQAMAFDPLSEVQKVRLNIIRESGQSLLAILNDILDLSKVEAGQLTLEEIDLDLARVLGAAHATFASIAEEKGVSLAVDIGDAAGVYRGDPTRLRQVVSNLISNALKFTTRGEVRVTAALDARGLNISVKDSGIGIKADALEAIFNRFTQADASITRTHGGAGLGLAISRELAQLMGGDIDADSTPGEGSTFTLRLPIWPSGELPAQASAELAEIEVHTGLKILVAEDNHINQLVVKTFLSELGAAPIVVSNGAEAVEAWRVEAFDVILMDVQMPVMDGIAATRRIREQEAQTGRPRTPIIALTANAMAQHVEDYARAGMDAFVPKPIDLRTLVACLERVLDEEPPAMGEVEAG